ncbi:MAG: hypothetical protein U0931_14050 [Vulcanimicrobiota bacterium]
MEAEVAGVLAKVPAADGRFPKADFDIKLRARTDFYPAGRRPITIEWKNPQATAKALSVQSRPMLGNHFAHAASPDTERSRTIQLHFNERHQIEAKKGGGDPSC